MILTRKHVTDQRTHPPPPTHTHTHTCTQCRVFASLRMLIDSARLSATSLGCVQCAKADMHSFLSMNCHFKCDSWSIVLTNCGVFLKSETGGRELCLLRASEYCCLLSCVVRAVRACDWRLVTD